MKILNLGCGLKTSDHESVVNIDWSAYLRIGRNPILKKIAPLLLSEERRKRLETVPSNVLVHDLSKGIPFEDNSVDAVFHSHLFEHLDREVGVRFCEEVHRVLKPGGFHRIVLPDFEFLANEYVENGATCGDTEEDLKKHEELIARMIEQCVRTEAAGTKGQKSFVKKSLDRVLFGDARKRGEVHRWMYDRHTLKGVLENTGYIDASVKSFNESEITDWKEFALEVNSDGSEYKNRSLYMEGKKPSK